MKLLLINSLFCLFVGFSLMNCMPVKHGVEPHEHEEHLKLGIEKARKDGFMLFQVTNQGDKEILTTPVGVNKSRIIFIPDNGKIIEHYFTADIIPTVVKPGETKTWEFDVDVVLEHYKLKEEKNLQMIWSVNETKSAPHIFTQRN